jgi:hypothetical protein
VSANQILEELPNLSHAERRAISKRLIELEADRDTLQFATEAAEAAFGELDRMEAEDARTAQG